MSLPLQVRPVHLCLWNAQERSGGEHEERDNNLKKIARVCK
jgi:hypothetical protein